MKITNKNIRKTLITLVSILLLIAIADLALAFTSGSLGDFFKGYSIAVIPTMVVVAYAYVGFPIFTFDGEAEMLHIQSHLSFNKLLGKELYVTRANIQHFEIDRSGIRKKMIITYLKDGKELKEKFSISLLSKSKIDKLAESVKMIESETKLFANSQLFI